MKAIIQLELFGEDYERNMRLMEGLYRCIPGGASLWGESEKIKKPWVAKITGLDPKYKYKREFLKSNKDYSHANSKGSRGIYLNYILESGCLYDVSCQISWKNWDRYFCYVDENGDIIRIEELDVKEWLNQNTQLE